MGAGVTLGPPPKCLQRGAPACPELYEEWIYVPRRIYVDIDYFHPGETAPSGWTQKMYVKDEIRLHIHLSRCLLGAGHEGGHLTDTVRHSRIRWSYEEGDVGGGTDTGRNSDPAAAPQ